jgi:hypothetical protein
MDNAEIHHRTRHSRRRPDDASRSSGGFAALLRELGPRAQWIESYVTDDKLYCVYIAEDAEAIREHAAQGGFPANRISEIRAIIDPATA